MRVLKKPLQKIALGAAIAALSISAQATAYVFDTGTPGTSQSTSLYYYSMFDPMFGMTYYSQGIAGAFSLDSPTTISSVEAYLGMSSAATVTYQVRQGSGNWNGDVIATGNVTVGTTPGWYGLTGLNQAVTADTYTLFLLPQYGANGRAYVPATSGPDALSAGWTFNTQGGTLYGGSSAYGIRIGGEPTPVPAPLPILGAVAAFGWSRKLRRRIRESQALAA